MAMPPALPGGYQLWHYYSSVPGGVIMAITFLGLCLSHTWFIVRTRRRFCIPLAVGGLFEVVGYCARAAAHYNPASKTSYAIQSLLILLAPILFAASVYMYLGRIIAAVEGQKYCLIPARILTKIFVAGDVLCFLIQAGGGGMLATAKEPSKVAVGENIILGGLILQIWIFGLFVLMAALFQLKMRIGAATERVDSAPWQRALVGLYVVSALIAIRNIIRAIEYGMGSEDYLLAHEWTIFIFDGLLMMLVLTICHLWYRSAIDQECAGEDSGRLKPLRASSPSPV